MVARTIFVEFFQGFSHAQKDDLIIDNREIKWLPKNADNVKRMEVGKWDVMSVPVSEHVPYRGIS